MSARSADERETTIDFPIISADSHTYVPSDLWKRLPDDLQSIAPRLEIVDGQTVHVIMGQEVLRLPAMLDDDGLTPLESALPVEHRLAKLDAEGIVAEVLYPTWVPCPDARLAVEYSKAYNDWGMEVYGDFSDRQVLLALVYPDDVDAAAREIERVAAMGYRGITLPMVPEVPYADDRYESLWAPAEAHELTVAIHVGGPMRKPSPNGIQARRDAPGLPYGPTSTQEPAKLVATLVDSGVCERHPNLQFVMGEAGAAWLPWLCQTMDERFEFAYPIRPTERTKLPGYRGRAGWSLPLKPSDYIRRNIHTTFQYDPTALRAIDIVGDRALMWHSDFPHVSGTYPHSREVIERQLIDVNLPDDVRDAVFAGNAAQLFRIPLPAVRTSST